MKRPFSIFLAALFMLALAGPVARAQSAAPVGAAAPPAPLSASHRRAAEALLVATDSEKNLALTMDRLLAGQLEQNPGMRAVEPEMRAYLAKYLSWAALKDEMVQLYAQAFTEKELKELTKFYQSPIGRKTIEKLPELTTAGLEIGQRRMQQNLPELERAISEKMRNQPPASE